MFSVKTCMFKTAAYTGSKYGHIRVWLYDVRESMFSVQTCMFQTAAYTGSKYGHFHVWLYDVRAHVLRPNMHVPDCSIYRLQIWTHSCLVIWCQSPCSQSKHAFLRLQHIPVPNMDTFMSGYTMSQSPCSQSKHACLRPRILEVLIGTFVDIYKKKAFISMLTRSWVFISYTVGIRFFSKIIIRLR